MAVGVGAPWCPPKVIGLGPVLEQVLAVEQRSAQAALVQASEPEKAPVRPLLAPVRRLRQPFERLLVVGFERPLQCLFAVD